MSIEYLVINHLDEHNRMFRLPDYHIVPVGLGGQLDSHGFSYIQTKKYYEELELRQNDAKQ